MAKTRLPYAAEFRRQMVELVRAGRTPEELATEFEPTAQSIRNWVAQSDRNAGRGDGGLTTAEREELTHTSVIKTTFLLYFATPAGMMASCDATGAVSIIGRWKPFV